MASVSSSTYLPTSEFVGGAAGIALALTFAIGVIVVGVNAFWRLLRPEDWR